MPEYSFPHSTIFAIFSFFGAVLVSGVCGEFCNRPVNWMLVVIGVLALRKRVVQY